MDLGDIADKAKDLIGDNADKVEEGIDKVADLVDEKTGGKYTEQIDGAAEKLKGVHPRRRRGLNVGSTSAGSGRVARPGPGSAGRGRIRPSVDGREVGECGSEGSAFGGRVEGPLARHG